MNVCIVSIHIFTQLSVTYGDIINIILAIFLQCVHCIQVF